MRCHKKNRYGRNWSFSGINFRASYEASHFCNTVGRVCKFDLTLRRTSKAKKSLRPNKSLFSNFNIKQWSSGYHGLAWYWATQVVKWWLVDWLSERHYQPHCRRLPLSCPATLDSGPELYGQQVWPAGLVSLLVIVLHQKQTGRPKTDKTRFDMRYMG